MLKLCCLFISGLCTFSSSFSKQNIYFLNQKVMNCKYCYLVIFIFKLFVALQGKWKKLFRFLQLLRAKLFPSPYIYEQTCSFSLQNYEQTCSLSLQNYEQGVQDFKIFNFRGLFLLTGAPNEKEYNMGCLSFCPLFHPLEYRFPVLFPFNQQFF